MRKIILAVSLWMLSAPSWAQQFQLIEKNHQTLLAGQNAYVVLDIDGATFDQKSLTADAQGVIDITQWRQAQADKLQKYPRRAKIKLYVGGQQIALPPESLEATTPFRLEIDLGKLRVDGYYVDADGKRVTQVAQLYPAQIKDYIQKTTIGARQIRLYEVGADGPETMIENYIAFNADGGFRLYLKPNTKYRFDAIAETRWHFAEPTFTTGAGDQQLAVVVRPSPHVLYGEFLDLKSGRPITESVDIHGSDAYFSGNGEARYALFFDKLRTVEMKVSSDDQKKKYRKQAATVEIEEPLQRRDFSLEPLEGDPRTIDFRLKIAGVKLEKFYDVVSYLSGKDYFSQRGEDVGDQTYRFTLPQAGDYKLTIYSKRYIVQAPAQLSIEGNQTIELPATMKDTWVTVRVVDENNQPITFPDNKNNLRMHEPRVNCVILDKTAVVLQGGRGPYLDSGIADIGGALRPDEKGEVRFLLSEGGKFFLHARFENFRDATLPIEIKTGASETFTMKLERKP